MKVLSALCGFVLASALPSVLASPAAPRFKASRELESWLSKRQDGEKPAYEAQTIDMPIDHFKNKPQYKPYEKGTFKQRYFVDSSYYKPGGPVFLYISGETSGESRFSNLQTGIIQIMMEAFNGLGVILENRYYGKSFPFNTSTTDELRYLTTEQTIADSAYFAQHATFKGISADLTATKTPWIMYGGSLAGAQVAFTMKTYNEIFAGGIGSSATAQALLEYPQWYHPIIKFGPSDCISRIVSLVEKMDALIKSNNKQGIQQLKDLFGLGALKNLGDFGMTIAFPIGGPMFYPTNTWQELNWSPLYGSSDFWNFCSNVTNLEPPEDVKKVDYALAKYSKGEPWTGLGGYTDYIKKTLVPQCESGRIDSTDEGCFGTQNETYWAETSNGADRSYLWESCAEQGAFMVAPKTGPSLILHTLQVPYTHQWCKWAFPNGKYNKLPPTPQLQEYNKYGGYNIQAPRLALIDGNTDVWLDLCYHSNIATSKQGVRISSDEHPSYLIASGGHHWDSFGIKNVSAEPAEIREAHRWEIRTVTKFLDMWKKKGYGKQA